MLKVYVDEIKSSVLVIPRYSDVIDDLSSIPCNLERKIRVFSPSDY